jgi:ATP-binding cassette subfamily C protein
MPDTPSLRDFAAAVVASERGAVALNLALLLLAGLTEGVSLLVFVPALQLLQDAGAQHGAVARVLGASGVPYRLGPVLLLCVALVGVRALLVYGKNRCAARLHFGFADRLRLRLYRGLGEAQWAVAGALRGADIEDMLTNGVSRVQSGVWSLLLLAQAVVLFGVYLSLSALASPTLTALVGSAGLALMLALRGQRRQAATLGARLNGDRQASFREMSALVSGLKVAKSFGRESAHAQRFANTVDATRGGYVRYADLSARSGLLFQVAAGALLGGAVYVGARQLALDLPTLLLLVFCVARLAPYLSQLQMHAQDLLFALPAWQQACTLEATLAAAREQPVSGDERFTLRRALDVEQLSVTYPGADRPALDGVTLSLPAGRCTALTGPSGAGKSTLADVLLGLIPADSGTLRIDGQTLRPALMQAWRRRVGYVQQETFLLPDSVRENLRLGDPQADDAALWQALDLAAAADFVRALPHGLDTPVGERGSRLSGGERQRLALARALLRQPLLLILDEVTASLDAVNQARIGEALDGLRGRVTILLITHRQALTRHADHTLVLEAGRLREYSPHEPDADINGARTSRDSTAALPV